MSKKNLFIAFEGIDGSGKSTQAKLLAEHLQQQNIASVLTCEPTSEPIGKMIRNIFAGNQNADQHTIAALFAADRLEHILNPESGILHHLNTGKTVVTDRYLLSSYAYQGVQVSLDWVMEINRKSSELLFPDITFFIDLLPEEAMQRIRQNRSDTEPYETLDNLQKVHAMYYSAMEMLSPQHKESIAIINGNQSIEDIATAVRSKLATNFA